MKIPKETNNFEVNPEDCREQVSFLNRELMLKEMLKYRKEGNLLDVGCAEGFFLKFAEKYFETYGIDISKGAIEQARRICPNSKLLVGEAQRRYPFKENFFDVVVCYDVLEHLSCPEKCVKEIFRVLKPEGYLFIQTPTDKSQKIIPDETHISLFSKQKLINLLKDGGFKIISFQKRRSILYLNRAFTKVAMPFYKENQKKAIDSYEEVSKSITSKTFIIRKLKLLLWQFDKLLSALTAAPEMFVIARKVQLIDD